MNEQLMTCEEADALLLDYLEESIEPELRARFDAHATSCARCGGLIRDIDRIRNSAAALPVLEPSRDLWTGIEARIQPGVVEIGQARQAAHWSRAWMAAAAAALIVVSSGLTWIAATRVLPTQGTAEPRQTPARVAAAPASTSEESAPAQDAEATSVTVPQSEIAGGSIQSPGTVTPSDRAAGSRRIGAPSTSVARVNATPFRGGAARSRLVSGEPELPLSEAEAAYGAEISELQTALAERREQLDPATVKVVEDNLKLIDAAVRQAREALRRDPASGFLSQQLDNVLSKKVELLRTVALLPSRT